MAGQNSRAEWKQERGSLLQLQQQQHQQGTPTAVQNGVDGGGGWPREDGQGNTTTTAFTMPCTGCRELRREVEDLKSRMQSICQFLLPNASAADSNMQSILTALTQSIANANNMSQLNPSMLAAVSSAPNSRKRPAITSILPPSTGIQPPQPEHPVALRPVPLGATLPSNFIQGWPWLLAPPIPAASPTLPVPLTEPHIDPSKQWSSPSSVESGGQKTDSSSGETSHIDPVGVDNSESSSTSSASTLAMLTSPSVSAAYANFVLGKTELPTEIPQSLNKQPALPHERKIRKQISDDYVKQIRQHDLAGVNVQDIQIPVKAALEADASFRAVSEQQIVQQIMQSKRFEDMDVRESMTQLCKKLAEKRVFGARLMAQTTVAGPNHSTYNNLPEEGIIYIKDVCRRVLGDRVASEEEFWELFRDAMRKLAARCRRVRHAKKTRTNREESLMCAEILRTMPNSLQLPQRPQFLLKQDTPLSPSTTNGFLTTSS